MRQIQFLLFAAVLSLGLLLGAGAHARIWGQPTKQSLTADVGFPPVGAKWVFRELSPGSSRTITYTAMEEGSYQGKPVYRATDGVTVIIFDKTTANEMARLRDGKEFRRYSPHLGTFSWPLAIGKEWRASFREDHWETGRSWDPIECSWKVEAVEDVSVPAGTFKAFRLQSLPGRNCGVKVTNWYSPEVKLDVRRSVERLAGHHLGPSTLTVELVEYRAPQPSGSLSAQAAPRAPTANVAFPPAGAKFLMRRTGAGSPRTVTYTVLEEASYADKPAYRVTDGSNEIIYDKATTNVIARLRDGKELVRLTPHGGSYSWPLAVGKEWRASFRSEHFDSGRSWDPVEASWKVEAYEDVTVPAGTFKTFRLQSTPGRNEGEKHTIWYSPELKFSVRRVDERLPGHYLGPAMFTQELVEYRPPQGLPASPPQPPTTSAARSSVGSNAPLPQATGPPRAAGTPMHTVTYRVKGTAEEASLTYRNAQGELVQTSITIPPNSMWALSFDASPGRFLYVSAQNVREKGSISCEILLDGNVKALVSGSGAYVMVSCNEEISNR